MASSPHRITGFMAAAVIFISTAATACTEAVVSVWRYASATVASFAAGFLNCASPKVGQVVDRPQVERVAAKAFVARLMKRERPRLEAGWRMCPSI
jgi:hypothetical protein